MGRKINMNRKNFTFRIDERFQNKLKIQAIKENRSVSDILNELVAEYLESKGIKVKPIN